MTLRELWAAWDKFWFEPTSPSAICIYRIVFGILAVLNGLLLLPNLLTFFGKNPMLSAETVQAWQWNEPRFSLFTYLPAGEHTAIAVMTLYLVSALFLTAGLFTRSSALVLFLCLVSLQHSAPCIMNGGDTLMRQHALLLALSPAGLLYSIDNLRKRAGGSDSRAVLARPWVQRLLQLHISAVFCQSFFAKLDNRAWLDGTAIYYCNRAIELCSLPVPAFLDQLWFYQCLTYCVLLSEFALFSLVWVKELRYYVLVPAILLHLFINSSSSMLLLELIFFAPFINFVEPADVKLRRWFSKAKALSVA